ncbi:MAG: CDP-alcohol phosphatidyltransferase family protein [Ardenticatenales bacterium]|nr:CDP-alcohol phosphatidyltransferase family protein [Ardenticatenales bacterium]
MITDWLRGRTRGVVDSIAAVLHRLGLTPNALTLIGTAFMVGIGFLLSQGQLVVGGLLLAGAAAFDALDGGLARLTNRVTKFGAFLDSTTDRWAEAAVYGGLLWWYMSQQAQTEAMLVYAGIIGSILVSYTRARAEGLNIECKVGLFTRFERIVVLVLGLLTGYMWVALVLLAVLSNATAIQRIWHVYVQLEK